MPRWVWTPSIIFTISLYQSVRSTHSHCVVLVVVVTNRKVLEVFIQGLSPLILNLTPPTYHLHDPTLS